MNGLSGAALLEVLGAAATNIGLALLAAALIVRCLYARWHRADALHVLRDGAHYLRWHTRRDLHEEPWSHPPSPAPEVGSEVTVYYHAGHPHRWALRAPYRYLRVLLGVGAVTAGLGLLSPLLA